MKKQKKKDLSNYIKELKAQGFSVFEYPRDATEKEFPYQGKYFGGADPYKDDKDFYIPQGIPVRVNPHLPVERTVLASRIETREEIMLLTGEMTHGFIMDNVLYVSEEYYELMKTKLKP